MPKQSKSSAPKAKLDFKEQGLAKVKAEKAGKLATDKLANKKGKAGGVKIKKAKGGPPPSTASTEEKKTGPTAPAKSAPAKTAPAKK